MKLIRMFKPLVMLSAIAAANGAAAADPQVDIKTSHGTLRVELYAGKAPKTVASFLQYVRDGHFDGTIFHRVIDGFMIQGGGFDKSYNQKKTRDSIENEAANGLKNDLGTIAMARTSAPHSASSQFFINLKNNDFLNYTSPDPRGHGYAVFGKVVSGMDVVMKIGKLKTGSGGPFPTDAPQEMVAIEAVTVVEAAKK
jgi:peptidyl-prolyl cis-trans isomerase A (cyclophilin A)/peptidyl-prolyl cis-trans isomerase B (cyclophilin B)